jgi:hypothetical protein
MLVLHDATDFIYDREKIGLVGRLRLGSAKKDGWRRHHTVCGILMHSSMARNSGRVATEAGGHQVLDKTTIQKDQCIE